MSGKRHGGASALTFHLGLLLFELNDSYVPVLATPWQNRHRLRMARESIEIRGRRRSADFFAGFDWMPYKQRMLWRHGLPRLS